jgi:hypothetical protein
MDWLRRLFGVGRLKREAPLQTAGRVLPPASTQRTQLGLKEVDLPTGVVTLRSGEARAFLKVTGYPAHTHSPEETRAWLQGHARALNTLPGNAVLLVRSRPGGLEGHIAQQRAQTAALAEREPGSALARLAADQLAHARRLQETGQVRQTDAYVALRSPKGDAARLLAAADACRRHLAAVGVRAELVTDRALGDALATGWRPETGQVPNWYEDWRLGDEVVATLNYSPKNARVTAPRYVDGAPPRAAVRQVDGDGGGAPLPRLNGKALPR